MNGTFVVDKQEGWTSHDVVAKFRGIARTKRVGHLGTLDPIATGVLPLIVGQATRLARFYTAAPKTYECVVRFGFATNTHDRTGGPTSLPAANPPGLAEVSDALSRFGGKQLQTPPQFSAKKVGGVPAYRAARNKQPVDLAPVEIEIYNLELLWYEPPDVKLRIHCSGGTYVRTLAHDLGQLLGCGAFLQELRRTQSGEFHISQARTLQQLAARNLLEEIIPMTGMLPQFPPALVDRDTVARIRQGRDFPLSPFRAISAAHVKVISPEGSLIAIGQAYLPNVYHPVVVFPPET